MAILLQAHSHIDYAHVALLLRRILQLADCRADTIHTCVSCHMSMKRRS